MEDSNHSAASSKFLSSQISVDVNSGNPEIDNAIHFWKLFDITNTRNQWDKTCNEMREMKTASISGRKRLNDLTKAFRSKSKDEQVNCISELLKAYQEEIDQLSRRSKLSETSFFSIFKALYDAPDPALYLDTLVKSIVSSNTYIIEIERLKTELSQYEEEFQRLKNQEVTIRRLEEQLQEFHQNNEQKVIDEIERRTELIRQECQQEVLECREMQKSVERRLSLALESARQAQTASDRAQSQLFEVSSKYEERISAVISENSLLVENIQRLQQRLNEIERQNDLLRQGSVSPHPLSSQLAQATEIADRNDSYDSLIQQLQDDLRVKEDKFRHEKLALESSIRELQAEMSKEREVAVKLRHELQERPSRQEFLLLKKRLRLVEKVAFQSTEEEGSRVSSSSPEREEDDLLGPEITQIPLENLLTGKIQSLEKDVLSLRKQSLELKEAEATQRDLVASLKMSLEKKQQIIVKLEQELETRNNALEKMIKEQNVRKESTLTDLADLLAAPVSSSSLLKNDQGGAGEKDQPVQQMVSILTNQRDRYKERLSQAEAKILKIEEALEATKLTKAQLEEENVQLFSRIKFLQNYPSSYSINKKYDAQATGLRSLNYYEEEARSNQEDGYFRQRHSQREVEDLESKYDHIYEQRMNPFAEFSSHEKQRKLRELSVADRIVLNTTLAIVQSNIGRNFLMVYLAAMHLLVFFTIYYTAHNVHHGCDPALDHLHPSSSH